MKNRTFLLILSVVIAPVLFLACEDSPVEPPMAGCIDADRDGYGEGCDLGPDCDDGSASINPGAIETCGEDNNCDEEPGDTCPSYPHMGGTCDTGNGTCDYNCDTGYGECDGDFENGCETDITSSDDHCGECFRSCSGDETCIDGDCVSTCIDVDGDGFGEGCSLGFDCDDNDEFRNPGAVEVCDGIDNDCDGSVDEQLVYSGTAPDNTTPVCMDGMWHFTCLPGYSNDNGSILDGCETYNP